MDYEAPHELELSLHDPIEDTTSEYPCILDISLLYMPVGLSVGWSITSRYVFSRAIGR